MAPVIELVEFFMTRLRAELPGDDAPEKGDTAEIPSINLGLAESPKKDGLWRVDLTVRLTPLRKKDSPANPDLDLCIAGIFRAPDDMPAAQRDFMLPYNGGLILYGILRGQVAAFSGAFPGGKVTLPSVNWPQVFAEIASRTPVEAKEIPGPEKEAEKKDKPAKASPRKKPTRRRAS